MGSKVKAKKSKNRIGKTSQGQSVGVLITLITSVHSQTDKALESLSNTCLEKLNGKQKA